MASPSTASASFAPPAGAASAGACAGVRPLEPPREPLRDLHDSLRTGEADVHWVRALVRLHGMRHPSRMGETEVPAFLGGPTSGRRGSVSRQRQAPAAVLFPSWRMFGRSLPWMAAPVRPRRKPRRPVVLTADALRRVLAGMDGTHAVPTRLLSGSGLRTTEALQLRIPDDGFVRPASIVRAGHGGKDRVGMPPALRASVLQQQADRARLPWQADRRASRGGVQRPVALGRRFPRAGLAWGWFRVFPQDSRATGPHIGVVRRHPLFAPTFQCAFKPAVDLADITRPATPQTLRHWPASHLPQAVIDIRTEQKLRGRSAVSTTMVDAHVLDVAWGALRSPLDVLAAAA